MAKKTSDQRPIVKDDPSRIIQSSLEDVMHNSMIPYAEHVIHDVQRDKRREHIEKDT